jgi:hypothetical protein
VKKTTIEQIHQFFDNKQIAVIGVSRNTKKFGYLVYAALKKKGYDVYAVNPNTSTNEDVGNFRTPYPLAKQNYKKIAFYSRFLFLIFCVFDPYVHKSADISLIRQALRGFGGVNKACFAQPPQCGTQHGAKGV